MFDDGPDTYARFGPVTVPRGRLWVMGDHRNYSLDSRYHCGAVAALKGCDPMESTIPVANVKGYLRR